MKVVVTVGEINKSGKSETNTVSHWPMPVRQSLCNLQRCGSFIADFPSKKANKKVHSAIGN
jgi:hypothetical protein